MMNKNKMFQDKLDRMFPNTYLLLSSYENNKQKVLIRHCECGYEWMVRPDEFNRAYKSKRVMCPSCSGRNGGKSLTHTDFVNRISRYFPGEYIFLNTYKNHNTSMQIKHKCGCVFERTAESLTKSLFNRGIITCPVCQPSRVGKKKDLHILTEKVEINLDDSVYKIGDMTTNYKNTLLLEKNISVLEKFENEELSNMGMIYGHQCQSTGKWYIGQTIQNKFLKRWNAGNGYTAKDPLTGEYKQKKFAMAIEKYGWDDFKHYMFGIFPYEDLDSIECELIKKFDSIKNGYNISEGGTGTYQRRENFNREKFSEMMTGASNPTARKVCMLDYETGEILKIYDAISVAAESIDAEGSRNVISQVCKGNKESAGGYKWKYYDEGDVAIGIPDDEIVLRKRSTRDICMIDMSDNSVLKIFKSIGEAAKFISLPSQSNISNVLNNTARQAGGYFWRYREDNDIDPCLAKGNILDRAVLRVKGIVMVDMDSGDYLKVFDTSYDAADFIGVKDSSNIRTVCRGIRNSAFGFGWIHATEMDESKPVKNITQKEISMYRKSSNEISSRQVYQYNMEGKYIAEFASIASAQKSLGINHIQEVCSGSRKSTGGFRWSLKKYDVLLDDKE